MLDRDEVTELLLDFEAYGWVYRVEFAGAGGRTLTEAGRKENERQLADELRESGSAAAVADAHAAFLPLNARFQTACTNWQIRPLPGEQMATNDHTDFRWDDRVLDALGSLGRRLALLCGELTVGSPGSAGTRTGTPRGSSVASGPGSTESAPIRVTRSGSSFTRT